MKRRSLLLAAVSTAIAAGAGCAAQKGGTMRRDGVDLATARRVLAAHRDELERRHPGTTGSGVGKVAADADPSRAYGIVVYVDDERHRPAEPQTVEGVPVVFVVTGEFRP
ncbi:hypothetical protein [Nonomuraea sp. NPDC050643]|uniref:hypothetical protein n=1 Tax=Nonomuraea sp. NPDC050643 TaxID=3155660 RepID=UPI0033C5187D